MRALAHERVFFADRDPEKLQLLVRFLCIVKKSGIVLFKIG
jgi:hypothetical protein